MIQSRTTTTTVSNSRPYILLTGATGLVGQYLIKDLLLAGQRLAVVVRPSKKMSVGQRIESIMQRWESELGISLPRPVVLAGDVAQASLGLSDEHVDWIGENCDRLIHNAAILQFEGTDRNSEPWVTNLGGTKNVLELIRKTAIHDLHYVSTAYVSGVSDSIVHENDFDRNQEFRNDYEHSKFESEKLVREFEIPGTTTIYRPAVIVGDSKTGFTSTYHGLYLYLRLLATLVPQQERNSDGIIETPIHLPMDGDEPRNLITVDWVSEVLVRLICNPNAHGRTFHLVPDSFVTARQVIEACYKYFNSEGVVFSGQNDERPMDNEFASKYFENARRYESYETSDPSFDRSNLIEFAGDVPCPKIDEDVILRFMVFGEKDRWGKRKPKMPENGFCFSSNFDAIRNALARHDSDMEFGLDVVGVGGGQWNVTSRKGQGSTISIGLPLSELPVIQVETDRLAQLVSDDHRVNGEATEYWSELLNTIESSKATVLANHADE